MHDKVLFLWEKKGRIFGEVFFFFSFVIVVVAPACEYVMLLVRLGDIRLPESLV